MPTPHLLARAVIRDADHVLVVRANGQPHAFLPGGYREPDEDLEACLRRELHEELGVEARVGRSRNPARRFHAFPFFAAGVPWQFADLWRQTHVWPTSSKRACSSAWIEHRPSEPSVGGSNPPGPASHLQ